jgi:hypothetical protein
LALLVALRHRAALRLLAGDAAHQHALAQQRLVLLRAIAAVGPDHAGRVAGIKEIAQARALMRCRVGDQPAPDQAMAAVGADVVLIAESRDRQVDRLAAILERLGLGVLDRPACVPVLLP